MVPVSMSIFLVLLLSAFLVCGEKVVLSGESDFNMDIAPYQVLVVSKTFLQSANETRICRGALISKNALITSAHCLKHISTKEDELLVVNGRENNYWKNSTVKSVSLHKNYNETSMDNDIALIKVINANFTSKPIDYSRKPPQEDTDCKVYSYRMSPPGVIDVKTSCVHSCRRTYRNGTNPKSDNFFYSMICAFASNKTENILCKERVAAGASLVCNGTLAGLLTFSRECSNSTIPSVYVNVSHYASWIEKTMNHANGPSMNSFIVMFASLISFAFAKLLSV